MKPVNRTSKFWLICIVLFLVLAGCSNSPSNRTVTPVSNNKPAEFPATQITPIEKTITPFGSPTTTIYQTTSPIASQTSVMVQQKDEIPVCLNDGEPPQLMNSNGLPLKSTLLFIQSDYVSIHSISGDLKNKSKLELSGTQKYRFFGVSPNGSWLAISPADLGGIENKQSNILPIRLISNTGHQIDTQVDFSHVTTYVQSADKELQVVSVGGWWLNDDTLALQISFNNDASASTGYLALPVYVNPFTGKWSDKFLDSFFKKDPIQDMLSWVSLSPDLSRAVRTLPGGTTLWDLKLEREVKTRNDIGSDNFVWSPDSQWAVFYDSVNKTTKMIDRDGEHLIEFDPIIEMNSDLHANTYQYRWSPDSRLLAMVGVMENGGLEVGDSLLLVYDLEQEKYILKCVTQAPHTLPDVQWSPDGEFLVLSNIFEPIRVVDLQRREVFQLTEKGQVIGWVKNFLIK